MSTIEHHARRDLLMIDLLRRRENVPIIVSILSVIVAAMSFVVAKTMLDLTAKRDRASLEAEKLKDKLFLYGRPSDDGSSIDILPDSQDVIIQKKYIRFEYSEFVQSIDMAQATVRLDMEYLHPYFDKRVAYYNILLIERIGKKPRKGVKVHFEDYMPIIIDVDYIKNGKYHNNVSTYALTYVASWTEGRAGYKIKLTGLAYCAGVPNKPPDWWHSLDYALVDPRLPQTIPPGPKQLRFILCNVPGGI